jgi:hypothetical protein
MTPQRAQMIEAMILAGLSAGTREEYVRAVRRLAAYYRRSPDQLNEEEVRQYLLDLRKRGVARGTFQIVRYGLQFFFCRTLGRDWGLFGGKKGSVRRSRSGYLIHYRMSKFDICWVQSVTRSTGRALPSCTLAEYASTKPQR